MRILAFAFSAALGAAFAGVFYGLSKGFAVLKLKFFNGKANLPEAVGMMDDVVEGVSGTDTGWRMENGGGTINDIDYSQHAMERMAPDTPTVRA